MLINFYTKIELLGRAMQTWAKKKSAHELLKIVPAPLPSTWVDAYFPIPLDETKFLRAGKYDNLPSFSGIKSDH